jgi:hypothetical protein
MEQQPPSSLPPENSQPPATPEDFLKEVETPTIPAPGTEAPKGPVPDYAIPQAPPEPAPTVHREPDQPIFSKESDSSTEAAAEKEAPKRSPDYKSKVVRGLITAEGFISAQICGIASGADDIKGFQYTPDQVDMLQVMLEPFEELILEKCPAALPLLLVYGGIKVDQIRKAVAMRKTVKANAAARTDTSIYEKVANVATAQQEKPRKNFKISKNGEYRYDRFGNYVKAEEPKEKASIDDIERILECNKPSDVKAAFNLSDEWFAERGIDL